MGWLQKLFGRADEGAPPAESAAGQALAGAGERAGGAWDGYLERDDSGRTAVALDLSLAAAAPDPSRPTLLRVRCRLRAPRLDGQPEAAEAEALARVEDGLERALASGCGAVYAGRITRAGVREHLFYVADGTDPAAALQAARPALGDHAVEFTGEPDPAWSAYRDELFPAPRIRRWMEDRRAVEALASQGDDARQARPVRHLARFATAEAREAFGAELERLGFRAVDRLDDGAAPRPFSLGVERSDPLRLGHIHEVAVLVGELAERGQGEYAGWSAPVERGSGKTAGR